MLSLIFLTQLAFAIPSSMLTLESALEALGSAGKAPILCAEEKSTKAACSFSQVCAQLSPQRNSFVLHENENGERVPNMHMQQLGRMVFQCGLGQGRFRPDAVATEAPKAYDPMAFQRWLVRRPAEEQVAFNKVALAMADKMHEQFSGGGYGVGMLGGAGLPGREQFEKQFTDALSAAGVELTAGIQELKEKWVSVQLDNPYTGALGGFGSAATGVDWKKVPDGIRELMLDPFYNPSVLSDPSPEAAPAKERYMARFLAMSDLFASTRQSVLRVLEAQATARPERAAQIEEMKKRITSVRTEVSTDPMELATVCASPNAFYDGLTHTLKVCPQLLGMPTAQLKMVIAHEMGHAVDPCGAACPLHESAQGFQSSYSMVDVAALQGAPSSVFAKGVGYEENPFREVLGCLAGEDSLRAPAAKLEDALKIIERELALTRERGGATAPLEQFKARLPSLYQHYAGCNALPGHSRQQEAFSDWVAAEVMALEPNASSLVDLAGMFFAHECPTVVPDAAPQILQLLQQNNCLPPEFAQAQASQLLPEVYQVGMGLQQLEDAGRGAHPPAVERVNQLLRVQPQLRRNLGCSNESVSAVYCAP